MLDHDALGHAGRARGIDDIGEVAGIEADGGGLEIARLLSGPGSGIGFEIDHHRGRGQAGQGGIQHGAGRAMAQHHGRSTVGQHVAEPVGRIGRIERHIGAAGLQDRQQPDHHVQVALDADRHPIIGPHPQAAQMMP